MSRPLPIAWVAAAAVALGVTAVASPGNAAAASGSHWNKPVLVSKTQASRETSLAMDPHDPKRQLICDPSGVPDVFDGQSYFHRSNDGGRSWQYTKVETANDRHP